MSDVARSNALTERERLEERRRTVLRSRREQTDRHRRLAHKLDELERERRALLRREAAGESVAKAISANQAATDTARAELRDAKDRIAAATEEYRGLNFELDRLHAKHFADFAAEAQEASDAALAKRQAALDALRDYEQAHGAAAALWSRLASAEQAINNRRLGRVPDVPPCVTEAARKLPAAPEPVPEAVRRARKRRVIDALAPRALREWLGLPEQPKPKPPKRAEDLIA